MNMENNVFLQTPRLENIGSPPTHPYSLPIGGRVHISRFEDIIRYLTKRKTFRMNVDQTNEREKIFADSHAILSSLKKLTDQKIADFCYHIVYLNQNVLGLETVDYYKRILSKHFPNHTWEYPDENFIQNLFDNFERKIVSFDALNSKDFLIDTVIQLYNKKMIDIKTYEELTSNKKAIHVANLLEIFSLTNYPIIKQWIKINDIELKSFQKRVKLFVLSQLETDNDLSQKILYLIKILNMDINKEDYQAYNELLSELVHETKKKDNPLRRALMFLIGACYGSLISGMLDINIEVITMRRLLTNFIYTFIQTSEFNLKDSLSTVLNWDLNKNLSIQIVQGYMNIYFLMNKYLIELPDSDTKRSIEKKRALLYNAIFEGFMSLFPKNNPYPIPKQIERFDIRPSSKINLKILGAQILADKATDVQNKNFSKYFNIYKSIIDNFKSDALSSIFLLPIELYSKKYNFQDILKKILSEYEEIGILTECKTFHSEILGRVSEVFNYIQNNESLYPGMKTYTYTVVIYFLSEWIFNMWDTPIFSEYLLIVSPIISIAFIRIAKIYYRTKRETQAFLTYFNMNYFMDLSLDILKGFDFIYDRKKQITNSKTITNYLDDIKKWNQDSIFSEEKMKWNITEIELSLSISDTVIEDPIHGIIEDIIISDYMDLSSKFEEFYNLKYSDEQPFAEFLAKSSLFTKPKFDRYNIWSSIGSSKPEIVEKFPFPLIRNIPAMSRALIMLPITVNLDEVVKTNKLNNFMNFYTT